MKKLFMLLFACMMWNVNLHSEEYTWTKIRNQGTFQSEKMGLSSTGYDRTNNIIYSMKYVNDVMIVMAYDIDRDTNPIYLLCLFCFKFQAYSYSRCLVF